MSPSLSLEGPVEFLDGKLVLRIPLDQGGTDLVPLTRAIASVVGDELVVEIQPWLAEKLGIRAGSMVVVSNLNGRFNLIRSDDNDPQKGM